MKKLERITIERLKRIAASRDVICFGAGIQGQRAAIFLKNWNLFDRLAAYADNDPLKIGKSVRAFDRDIPIIAAKDILNYVPNTTLIIITSLCYKQIYENLNNILSSEEIPVISLDEIADTELEESSYPEVIKDSDEPVIPKIIHYAWFGKEKPESIVRNIDNWKKLCPNYQFIEWNDSNYCVSKNKYMYQAFQKKAWGFVTDYLRLDVLYHYGGIYLDTDIELLQNPEALLYQNCFGCVDASLTMNLGSGFGCKPGEPIIKELRDYYDNCDFIKTDGSLDRTTCNTHSLKVLIKHNIKINNRLQNVGGMEIYPMIFQGKNQYTRKIKVTEKTFWIHHGNMSWFNKQN